MIPRNRNCHDYTKSVYKVAIKWENGSLSLALIF
jgi:hypothetical protein